MKRANNSLSDSKMVDIRRRGLLLALFGACAAIGDRRILGRPYERGLRDRPGCLFVFMNEHLPRVAGLAIREEREAIHTAWELTHVGLSARCRGGRSTPPGAHRRSPRACAAISRRLDGQRRMPKSKKSGAACQIGGASQH